MGEHNCGTCSDCIHNGNKCCGCYDGSCCRENTWLERVRPPAWTIPAEFVSGTVGEWVEVVRLDQLREATRTELDLTPAAQPEQTEPTAGGSSNG